MIAKAIETQVELMKNMTTLLNTFAELKTIDSKCQYERASVNQHGDAIITPDIVPLNHFDNTNSFKSKDTDVERFLSMCKKCNVAGICLIPPGYHK